MAWPSTSSFQTGSSSAAPGFSAGKEVAQRPVGERIGRVNTVMDELSRVSTVPPGLRNPPVAGQPDNYATGNPMRPGAIPSGMRERRAGMPASMPSVMSGGLLEMESYFNGRSGNNPIVPINIEAMPMLDGSELQFTVPGHVTFAMTGEGETFRSMTQNRQLTLIRSLEQLNMDVAEYFAEGVKVLNDAIRKGEGIGAVSASKLRDLMRNDTSLWFNDPDFQKTINSNNLSHRMLGYLSLEFIMQKWKLIAVSSGQLTEGLAGMSYEVAVCAKGVQHDVINVWGTKVRPLDTVGFILKFVNTYADVGNGQKRLTGVSSPKFIPWHGSKAGPTPEEKACVDVTKSVNCSGIFVRLGTVTCFALGSTTIPSERFNYAAQAGLVSRPRSGDHINPIVEHKMTVSVNIKVYW